MYRIIDMHSKYDNMHKNIIFYALVCINNHVITGISYMLSRTLRYEESRVDEIDRELNGREVDTYDGEGEEENKGLSC